jgi:hypothetical protein
VARILNSLAAAGYPCEHVDVANAFVLANGAIDEAMADCGGENLDIAVFPTAEQAEEYGRQGGGPYAAGDGWVIVTETLTLAERIADALGGPPDSSSLLTASHPLRLPNLLLHELSGSDLLHAIRTYGSITADHG